VLTEIIVCVIMKKLDKRNIALHKKNEPNEGERTLLSSNNCGMRSPSLDILLEGFIWQHENGKQNKK
jgi:hypothetical protein